MATVLEAIKQATGGGGGVSGKAAEPASSEKPGAPMPMPIPRARAKVTTDPRAFPPAATGGKGLGQSGTKRHQKIRRNSIMGVTKPAIRRLARRGGVKRMQDKIYDEIRGILKEDLEEVLHIAILYAESAGRKTVTAMDVVFALNRMGRTLYGFQVRH